MSAYNVFCLWAKVHQIFNPRRERGFITDHLLFRFSLCWSIPELFALKVDSCQKSRRILDVFCTPKFCLGTLGKVVRTLSRLPHATSPANVS